MSDAAEERLVERMLDAADARKTMPALELARLSDARLAELLREADTRSLDVTGLRLMLGRLEERALAPVITAIRGRPIDAGAFAAAGPICAAELAPLVVQVLAKEDDEDFEGDAERWLMRHPEAAVEGLTADEPTTRFALGLAVARSGVAIGPLAPLAVLSKLDRKVARAAARGRDASVFDRIESSTPDLSLVPYVVHALGGPARERALLWLKTHEALVRPLLEAEPHRFADALAALGGDKSAGDRALEDVPTSIPALPAFVDPSALPAVHTREGSALSTEETLALAEMLRFSPLARPYAGVAQVRAACDADALDRFATALLAAWVDADAPPTERWALESVGKIGGPVATQALAARTRSWAIGATPPRSEWDDHSRTMVLAREGDRAWSYARSGVEVLGTLGTNAAFTELDDLARRGSASWLRKEAEKQLDRLAGRATRSGVPSRMVIEDTMVPDLGLDVTGSLALSLGPRAVRVGFDEKLAPIALDEQGARLATFPRLKKTDDASAYAAAKQRWTALQASCETLAKQQLGALEEAMCAVRTWRVQDHAARFIQHPLLRHLGRRLVWACVDAEGEPTATFRIAEDLTLADVDDAPFAPDEDARLAVAHPLALAPALRARWTTLFGDYQILQPFPQLGRELFEGAGLSGEEVASARDRVTSRGRLFQLGRRGWSARGEGGVMARWERELPRSGAIARVEVSPGLVQGDTTEAHRIVSARSSIPLERLPPIDRSELLRELDRLAR